MSQTLGTALGERLAKLRGHLAVEGIEALLVSDPENRRYLSGFTGSAGTLLVTAGRAAIATDFRYYEQASQEAPSFELFRLPNGRLHEQLGELLASMGTRRLACEGHAVTYAAYEVLRQAAADVGVELQCAPPIVERLRAVKDAQEIRCIERGVELADRALARAVEVVEPGMSERAVAWEIEKYLREHGAEGVAFEVIVAAGERAALPHARPTDRQIGTGEPVILDLGAKVEGYSSDLTRTAYLGTPDTRFEEIYELVRRALDTAIAGVRPGMLGKEADALARDVVEQAGYGEAFGHGLGHGLGLATHEAPGLRKTSEDRLQEGMVFTIEPGVYVRGWGGIRLEDVVVLEASGARVLTRAPRLSFQRA